MVLQQMKDLKYKAYAIDENQWSLIRKPINKSDSIDSNYLIDIDWYLPIDDQLIVTKICPFASQWLSIVIDCQCQVFLRHLLLWVLR